MRRSLPPWRVNCWTHKAEPCEHVLYWCIPLLEEETEQSEAMEIFDLLYSTERGQVPLSMGTLSNAQGLKVD